MVESLPSVTVEGCGDSTASSRGMGLMVSLGRRRRNEGSVEVEFAERLAGIGRLLRFFNGLGETLVEDVFLILLGFEGLTEEAFLALFLFAEMAGGLVEVFEGTFAGSGRVGDDGARGDIDLEHRPAIGTGDFQRRAGFGFNRHGTSLLQRVSVPQGGAGQPGWRQEPGPPAAESLKQARISEAERGQAARRRRRLGGEQKSGKPQRRWYFRGSERG